MSFRERERIRTFDRPDCNRDALYFRNCYMNYENKKTHNKNCEFRSERERIRTFDRLLRRQMLYPAELRTH